MHEWKTLPEVEWDEAVVGKHALNFSNVGGLMNMIPFDGELILEEDDWPDGDDPDEDDEDEWECQFPASCVMPGDHMRSECYTAQMAEEWYRENQDS